MNPKFSSRNFPIIFAGIFGNINPPPGVDKYVSKGGNPGGGLFLFISNLFFLAGVIAGVYAVFQFISAGYGYLSAAGDPKKVEAAWAQIWQSALGLVIIASAFILAGVVEKLTGLSILSPVIYGP